jgi:SAM-dependent methyltransferase
MDLPSQRRTWERRWSSPPEGGFPWTLEEPPPEVIALLDGGDAPAGPALDVGCGDGMITRYLSERLGRTVGMDLAMEALRMARGRNPGPTYMAAAAPVLPFRDGAFGLVLDRGTMHLLPRPSWRPYLREVLRVLRPGGRFVLYVPRPGARGRLLHLAFAAAAPLLGKRHAPSPSIRTVARALPPGLDLVEGRAAAYRGPDGVRRSILFLLARGRPGRRGILPPRGRRLDADHGPR